MAIVPRNGNGNLKNGYTFLENATGMTSRNGFHIFICYTLTAYEVSFTSI